jgi:hypothetical protein
MNKQLPTPKAFKRSPSLEISTWYKGILSTQLAGEVDTGGAFDLVVSKMRKGTEEEWLKITMDASGALAAEP